MFPTSLVVVASLPAAMASSVVDEFDSLSSANKTRMLFEEETTRAALREVSGALMGCLIVVLVAHVSGRRPRWGKPPAMEAAETEQDGSEVTAMQAFPQLPGPAALRLWNETNVLASQVSAGHANLVPQIIKSSLRHLRFHHPEPAMKNMFVERLVLSAVRSCASNRLFPEALGAYRQWAAMVEDPPCNLWSLLLWACAEAHDLDDGAFFIGKLHAAQEDGRWEISHFDFVNIARVCFHRKDMVLFQQALQKWDEAGMQMGLSTRNRVLGLFAANPSINGIEFATELIKSISYIPLDTGAYNTLMRGYAAAKKWYVCLQLYDQMREEGITPSDVTFGVLLDSCIKSGKVKHVKALFACIKSGKVKHVKALFEDLRVSGIPRKVVHKTTFIKGLVAAGDLDHALEILTEMGEMTDSRPDVITYFTLTKAYADAGRVEEGISLLQRMREQGVTPDEAQFNIILGGCCNQTFEANQILSIFNQICAFGFVPTSATLSVLVKACAKNEVVMLAMEIVEGAPQRFGWTPELRIYIQLARAACTAGLGSCVLEVYALMVQALGMTVAHLDDATRARFCRFCERCQLPAERYAHIRAFGPSACGLPGCPSMAAKGGESPP